MKAYRPENLEQLKELLLNCSLKLTFVAGGTDLIIQMRQTEMEYECLVYLGQVGEMKEIKMQERGVFIGASCTMTELSDNSLLSGAYGTLTEAAGCVGSVQVRNRATIGGNIAHASAAADLVAPLMCLNAETVILREDQIIKLPVAALIVGDKKTLLGERDVIIGFLLPIQTEAMSSHYYKLGFRKKVSISRFGIAIAMKIENDIVESASVVIGAIGAKAVRMDDIERLVCKKPLTEAVIKEAGRLLSTYIANTSKRKYKMWASQSVMEDAFDLFIPKREEMPLEKC